MNTKSLLYCIAAALIGCATQAGCNSLPKSNARDGIKYQQSTVAHPLGDSITSIIINAKSVKCSLIAKSDTVPQNSVIELSQESKAIFLYLLCQPVNFQTDKIVYGRFMPWTRFTCAKGGNKVVHVEFDYSLKKWRILDHMRNTIVTGDTGTNNEQLMLFAQELFPLEPNLKLLSNKSTK